MTFGKVSEFTGGAFFSPKEHQTALGLLVEPKRVDRNVEHTYKGKTGVRDELTADISVFSNQDALDSGKPTDILKAVKITQKYLVSDAGKLKDSGVSAFATVIATTQTQGGEAFVWRDAPSDVTKVIQDYYTQRNAAASAAPAFA